MSRSLTVSRAAQLVGVSRAVLQRMIRAGELIQSEGLVDIAELLRGWGYEVTEGIGRTGVVARMRCGDGTKSIGLRAGTDALAVSIGIRGKDLPRNVPTVFNTALQFVQHYGENRPNYLLALAWVLDNWRAEGDPVRRRLALIAEAISTASAEHSGSQASATDGGEG